MDILLLAHILLASGFYQSPSSHDLLQNIPTESLTAGFPPDICSTQLAIFHVPTAVLALAGCWPLLRDALTLAQRVPS